MPNLFPWGLGLLLIAAILFIADYQLKSGALFRTVGILAYICTALGSICAIVGIGQWLFT